MNEKIESQHLDRKAILYVRQSSSFQVQHNEESRKLQYAMQQRLRTLGWQQVDVIDEDLGRSASGSVVRSGFERMVADVCLGKVGAVAAREVSRFAHQQASSEVVAVDEFAQLASDVDVVWNDPRADIRLKKRIVRTLIEDIIADVDADASEVVMTIHWVGGVHTELRVPRRRRGKATATSTEMVDAVRSLSRICTDDMIAGVLNRNGSLTGRGNRWTRERVTSMRQYHKIRCHSEQTQREEGWMNLTEASKFLGVSTRTLRLAIERGDIAGEHPLSDGPWVINRQQLETPRAQSVARQAKQRTGNPAVPDPEQKSLGF